MLKKFIKNIKYKLSGFVPESQSGTTRIFETTIILRSI